MMRNNDRLYEKIREINEREQNVVLSLVCGSQIVAIHFEKGMLSAANSNNPQFRLGVYMKEAGVIAESALTQLVREARRQRMFIGQIAVKKSLLDIDTLVELVQEQAVQILMHVLSENYEIRSVGKQLLEFYIPARMDLPHLLLLVARKTLTAFPIAPSQMVVLKDTSSLSHLPWYPEELAVMGLLKSPRRLREVQSMTGLDESQMEKILSVFNALELIEVVDAPTEDTTAIVRREGFPFDALVPQIPLSNVSWEMESFLNVNSFVSEQFKTLKVRMTAIANERPAKVITVTSPDTQAGKSLLSANLAAVYSRDPERKTIIIDCDFRKPSLHNIIGASVEPGLIGFLQDDRLQSFCYMRRLENLYLMTAGGRASDPIELLSLDKMRNFIEFLRSEFNTIILDAPPLSPISDAHILSGFSDGVILVVRSGKTSYASIERAARNLDPARVFGVVLNDVPPLMFNTEYDPSYYGETSAYPYGGESAPSGRRLKNYLEI